jgi:hypothetical protein
MRGSHAQVAINDDYELNARCPKALSVKLSSAGRLDMSFNLKWPRSGLTLVDDSYKEEAFVRQADHRQERWMTTNPVPSVSVTEANL